ncbi:hypothetical protein M2271_002262 [Streptomyces sp. LBL]|uniref:hypothetical protein n=1 Tax=Streptomyces sp. LBL TaxID=2940562 RepID=UPI0024735989|nr:hypothetical protein [Streptomyces sp. LBL]MDH6624460.1 hypothetical protein [Streptomyces sp. LBL]
MAGARRSARERGKSDPIDAEAVVRVALREPDLPKACLEGPSRDIKLLIDHRRTLVAQRTAIGDKREISWMNRRMRDPHVRWCERRDGRPVPPTRFSAVPERAPRLARSVVSVVLSAAVMPAERPPGSVIEVSWIRMA